MDRRAGYANATVASTALSAAGPGKANREELTADEKMDVFVEDLVCRSPDRARVTESASHTEPDVFHCRIAGLERPVGTLHCRWTKWCPWCCFSTGICTSTVRMAHAEPALSRRSTPTHCSRQQLQETNVALLRSWFPTPSTGSSWEFYALCGSTQPPHQVVLLLLQAPRDAHSRRLSPPCVLAGPA